MELQRTKDTSWACPAAMLDGHVLVEAYFPRSKEDETLVVIPWVYYKGNFPRLINKGWGVSVIEPKYTSSGVKAEFRHESPKAIGTWIFLLIKGYDTTKNVPLSYRAGGH